MLPSHVLVLAPKARSHPERGILGSWLYGVAYRTPSTRGKKGFDETRTRPCFVGARGRLKRPTTVLREVRRPCMRR